MSRFPSLSPAAPSPVPVKQFRVEADWHGGGFGYTIPAASAEDAYLWGEHRARFHRDAEITVTPAYPADVQLVDNLRAVGGL